MKAQMEIQWDKAVQQATILDKRQQVEQSEALAEFQDSFCDMFSIQDWIYYSEKTGKSIAELKAMAKYEDDNSLSSHLIGLVSNGELDADDLAGMNF